MLVTVRAVAHMDRILRCFIFALDVEQVADERPQVTLSASKLIVKVELVLGLIGCGSSFHRLAS